jgi:hypothetical protein
MQCLEGEKRDIERKKLRERDVVSTTTCYIPYCCLSIMPYMTV